MVRAHPDDPLVLSLGADFLSAGPGAIADAEAQFQKAIEIAQDDPLVRFHYGKHLLRVKRYADARCELELADRLGDSRALDLLSNIEPEDDE
jgi:predicted Zn-dependent protease